MFTVSHVHRKEFPDARSTAAVKTRNCSDRLHGERGGGRTGTDERREDPQRRAHAHARARESRPKTQTHLSARDGLERLDELRGGGRVLLVAREEVEEGLVGDVAVAVGIHNGHNLVHGGIAVLALDIREVVAVDRRTREGEKCLVSIGGEMLGLQRVLEITRERMCGPE